MVVALAALPHAQLRLPVLAELPLERAGAAREADRCHHDRLVLPVAKGCPGAVASELLWEAWGGTIESAGPSSMAASAPGPRRVV